MYFPRLLMLIGLPGSGKSTWAKTFIDANSNTVIISSDEIRKELFNNESSQEDNNRVFYEMNKRTLSNLSLGTNVIYDATNISRKKRKAFLDKVPTYVKKEAHVIWAPIKTCVNRDNFRKRTVGQNVIWKMVCSYQPPFFDEGFNYIYYHIDKVFDVEAYKKEVEFIMQEPHDNPHHKYNIAEHCNKTAEYISNNYYTKTSDYGVLVRAAKCHDCGKPLVKSFHNNKGELTDIAHYYNHQNVGSYLIPGLFYYEGDNYITPISWLVNVHMDPYLDTKYYRNLPTFLKQKIDILHEADESAH